VVHQDAEALAGLFSLFRALWQACQPSMLLGFKQLEFACTARALLLLASSHPLPMHQLGLLCEVVGALGSLGGAEVVPYPPMAQLVSLVKGVPEVEQEAVAPRLLAVLAQSPSSLGEAADAAHLAWLMRWVAVTASSLVPGACPLQPAATAHAVPVAQAALVAQAAQWLCRSMRTLPAPFHDSVLSAVVQLGAATGASGVSTEAVYWVGCTVLAMASSHPTAALGPEAACLLQMLPAPTGGTAPRLKGNNQGRWRYACEAALTAAMASCEELSAPSDSARVASGSHLMAMLLAM